MERAARWWMTIDLKAKWRFVEYALKSRSQEVRNCNGKLMQAALGAG
ncbi:hypothetical protein A2U01_0118810, partial [Trifolium medium]|nr:hypothetical protein [Trifolium medium]